MEGELDPKKVAKEAKRLKKAAKRAEAEQDERKKKYNSFSTVSFSTCHPISGAWALGFGLWTLGFCKRLTVMSGAALANSASK